MMILGCAFIGVLHGQILPDLEGEELVNATVESFKPNFVETYSEARRLMYTQIYNEDDSVATLYSGHKLYLPPQEELPIQYLAMNGEPNGINTEHIYPRSKGAKEEYGNAFSDMHNLAPARWEVNTARANFPLMDVDDRDAERWYYSDMVATDASALDEQMIHSYAEVDGLGDFRGTFEPRESVKGDVARSVFYFYTMYREEALREDDSYFDQMKADLCAWHNTDPVDDIEMDRNLQKAAVQDGKPNPFIMDCTLVNRMYCPDYSVDACSNLTTGLDHTFDHAGAIEPAIKIYPNPNRGIFTLDISNITPGNYQVDIYFLSGQLIYSLQEKLDYFNSINMWNAKKGLHIIHLINHDTGRKYSGLFEIIR